jgi:DnaJ-domain-containing protein 1
LPQEVPQVLASRRQRLHTSIMQRKSRLAILELEAELPARPCDHPGCPAGGDFRAPKSRLDLRSYYWFCIEHVRAYNSSWNYYAGMSESEIEAEIRSDTVWQRPSWPLGERRAPRFGAPLRDAFDLFSDDSSAGKERPGKGLSIPLSPREEALAVFGMEPPITPVRLKARYKALVKLHHPDTHGGDKAAEEKLKIINRAYATLKASYLG